MYDVVHQNIIFEAHLKDSDALDLPSGTLRVLCVETNDIHLHLLEGVGYIVDPLPNNPGWSVTHYKKKHIRDILGRTKFFSVILMTLL